MRKQLLFLITLIMVVGLFAGCESKGEENDLTIKGDITEKNKDKIEEEIVESLVADITVQTEEEWLPYYQAAANRVLKDNKDSTISFIVSESFDHLNKLETTNIDDVEIADVFALPVDRIYDLAHKGALAEIDVLTMAATIDNFGDYDTRLSGKFNDDGYYLAFPMSIETLINFVNTANAQARDIDLSTTIEFTELEYQDILIPVFNAWYGVAVTKAADIDMLSMNDEGGLYSDLTKDFADLTAAQQDVFTALYKYWKAHNIAKTEFWNKDNTWGYIDSEFSTGGINAIRIEGPESTSRLSEMAGLGEDLDILPLSQVTVAGNPLAHWKSGWGLGINARLVGEEEKMLLSQAMIKEIVNPTFAIEFFVATGKVLGNVDASVYEASNLNEIDKKVISAVIESYKKAPSRLVFSEWNYVWGTWENALLSWEVVKPTSVENAYIEIKNAFDRMMLTFEQ